MNSLIRCGTAWLRRAVFLTLVNANRYPPFSLSPDGRWLVFSDLTVYIKTVGFFILHYGKQETKRFGTAFPAYPARYPYYDWSADGRWLAVQDDGFMRLAADVDFNDLCRMSLMLAIIRLG